MRQIAIALVVLTASAGVATAQQNQDWIFEQIRIAMDPNNDRLMTRGEYEAYHRHDPPTPFASLDWNANGSLDGEEYYEALSEMQVKAMDCDWTLDSRYEREELACASEYFEP